jgi:hypothetical protein
MQEIHKESGKETRFSLNNLTNVIYRRGIPEVRELILEKTLVDTNVVVLFDNIDKGWPSGGLEPVDTRIVRLLLESLIKVGQDFTSHGRHFQSTVFLRNDVFELLMDDTPDRGRRGASTSIGPIEKNYGRLSFGAYNHRQEASV